MDIYKWAEKDGSITEEIYNEVVDKLTPQQVKDELVAAFNVFGNNVSIKRASEEMGDIYEVSIAYGYSIIVCIREMTPGGRSGLKNEQRIQPESRQINYIYDAIEEGKIAVLMGAYKRGGDVIFCAWKANSSNASNPKTGISKQIKIESIAQAMKEGFVQQLKGKGEYACAFRKEFIYFYVKNSKWLHDGSVGGNSEIDTSLAEAEDYADNLDEKLKGKYNRILFGAPGTGKSYKLEEDRQAFNNRFERVTFHPNYSYAQFVGTYKPKPKFRSDGTEYVSYEFVPGPFLRIWINAQKSIKNRSNDNYLLIIEEINRANVASVFGDVFQLLDRNENGRSEYEIATSEEMRTYLINECGFETDEVSTIRIPSNMYIWATMNTADQGVLPIDSAFKRRWNFEYIGINEGSSEIENSHITLKPYGTIKWNILRVEINNKLIEVGINEDKLIGPFFLSHKELKSSSIDEIFKSKLLMYLFDDVLRHRRGTLFKMELNTFSKIIDVYNEGQSIFAFDVQPVLPSETNEESSLGFVAATEEGVMENE
jgi:hypothetical protein